MSEVMIKKGDMVRVNPEFLDKGEEIFPIFALEDEDRGRAMEMARTYQGIADAMAEQWSL